MKSFNIIMSLAVITMCIYSQVAGMPAVSNEIPFGSGQTTLASNSESKVPKVLSSSTNSSDSALTPSVKTDNTSLLASTSNASSSTESTVATSTHNSSTATPTPISLATIPASSDESVKVSKAETPSSITKDPENKDKDIQTNERQDETPAVPKSGASSITYSVATLALALVLASY